MKKGNSLKKSGKKPVYSVIFCIDYKFPMSNITMIELETC